MKGLAVLLAACHADPGARTSSPPPPPFAPAVTVDAPPAGIAVRWSNIETTSSCFYFSGPYNGTETKLAGDAELHVDGATIELRLGAATFAGRVDGDQVSLVRDSEHEHDGQQWRVTETITGTYEAGQVHGHYTYRECCPDRCVMTADLTTHSASR